MIDITDEEILTFTQAAEWLPRRRKGKKTSLSTIWRWAECGIKAIKLECIHVGGVICTSTHALQRFFDRIGQARSGGSTPTGPQPTVRTEAQRRKASEQAGKTLDAMIKNPPRRGRRKAMAAGA